jgi:hypothetical protein
MLTFTLKILIAALLFPGKVLSLQRKYSLKTLKQHIHETIQRQELRAGD